MVGEKKALSDSFSLLLHNRQSSPGSSPVLLGNNLKGRNKAVQFSLLLYNAGNICLSTWMRVPWRTKTWLTSRRMSQPSTIILSMARFFLMTSKIKHGSQQLSWLAVFRGHTPQKKKDKDRRYGKGRRCCRASYFAPGRLEEYSRMNTSYSSNRPDARN